MACRTHRTCVSACLYGKEKGLPVPRRWRLLGPASRGFRQPMGDPPPQGASKAALLAFSLSGNCLRTDAAECLDGREGGGVPWSPRPLSTIFQSYLNIVLNLKCDPKAPLSKGKICGKAHYKCKFSRVESERSHKYLTFNLAIWLCVSSHSFLLLLLVLQQTSPLSHSLLLTAAEN